MLDISREFGQLALNKANIKGIAISARFLNDNGYPFIVVAYYDGEEPTNLSEVDYWELTEDGDYRVYLGIDCHVQFMKNGQARSLVY